MIGPREIGGGLGPRWERAEHKVRLLGCDGGVSSYADVVLVASPLARSRRRSAR